MSTKLFTNRWNCLWWWTVWIVALSAGGDGVSGLKYFTQKPSYIKSCRIYQPEFTKCSTESIQGLMNQLAIGIPEVKELFGDFDPMHLDQLEFKQDNNEVATIRANITDLVMKGFSKIKIKESKVSKKDFSWETKVFIPKLRIEGNYKMNGRILLVPLKGAGKMFIEIDNMDILMFTKTRLYEKGDFTFYNVTQVRVRLNITKVRTNFENLFNGNSKEVEKSTNEFFNENWRDFFEALRPLVNHAVERTLLDLLSKVFHLMPANFLVEDIPTSVQLYGKKS